MGELLKVISFSSIFYFFDIKTFFILFLLYNIKDDIPNGFFFNFIKIFYTMISLSIRLIYYKIKDKFFISHVINSYNYLDSIYMQIKGSIYNRLVGFIFGNIKISEIIPNIKPKSKNFLVNEPDQLATKDDINKFLDEL